MWYKNEVPTSISVTKYLKTFLNTYLINFNKYIFKNHYYSVFFFIWISVIFYQDIFSVSEFRKNTSFTSYKLGTVCLTGRVPSHMFGNYRNYCMILYIEHRVIQISGYLIN